METSLNTTKLAQQKQAATKKLAQQKQAVTTKLAQHNGNKPQHNKISTTQWKQASTQQN